MKCKPQNVKIGLYEAIQQQTYLSSSFIRPLGEAFRTTSSGDSGPECASIVGLDFIGDGLMVRASRSSRDVLGMMSNGFELQPNQTKSP